MPLRCIKALQDKERCDAFSEAVRRAVQCIEQKSIDSRVLCVGGGSGLLPMVALEAKAHHVTIAERCRLVIIECALSALLQMALLSTIVQRNLGS